jgi:pyruvate carboxylase subunit B
MKYFVQLGGREVVVELDGECATVEGVTYRVVLRRQNGTPLRVLTVDGRPRTLAVHQLSRGRWDLGLAGERREVDVVDERTRNIRSLASAQGRATRSGVLKAPMPGLVVRIQVEPGQTVPPGGALLVLEAMKMENELRAAAGGLVRAVLVGPGQAVEKGQALVELEAVHS